MPIAATGELTPGKWKRVLWGWGYFNLNYYINLYPASGDAKGRYESFVGGLPFPISSGALPDFVVHRVVGYGEIKITASQRCAYEVVATAGGRPPSSPNY